MKAYALRSARQQGSSWSVTLKKTQVSSVQSTDARTRIPAKRGGRSALAVRNRATPLTNLPTGTEEPTFQTATVPSTAG